MTNETTLAEKREREKTPRVIEITSLWEDRNPTPSGDKQLCAYRAQLRAKRRRRKGYYKLPKDLFNRGGKA